MSRTLLLAVCVLLAVAGPAAAGTYVEGVVGQPFTLHQLGEGLSIQGDEDQALVLDLAAIPDGGITEAVCFTLSHQQMSAPGTVSFLGFRVHTDVGQAAGISLAVFFDEPLDDVETDWERAPCTGTDETGAMVFTPPPYSGGHYLTYKLRFRVRHPGGAGTVTVADFAVDWGEYVEPPDGDGGGGRQGDHKATGGSGVFDMGDAGRDAAGDAAREPGGSGGATGSGSGGGAATGAGAGRDEKAASAGGQPGVDGGVDTDAVIVARAEAEPGDEVTGYPLRRRELLAATVEAGWGSQGDVGLATAHADPGASTAGLGWFAAALLFLGPPVVAALDCRHARRRLRALVESAPDESPAAG